MAQEQRNGVDEQAQRTIWRALGSYIAKQLINGKGVLIPRFGTLLSRQLNLTWLYVVVSSIFIP